MSAQATLVEATTLVKVADVDAHESPVWVDGSLSFTHRRVVVGEVPLERLWHSTPLFPTRSEIWLRLLEAYGL